MSLRYHRQTLLPGWGADGQARLSAAHAAIVGIGALGSGVAEQLARAGVGRLTLVDRDLVEPTNLQRQVLFDEADAEKRTPKAVAAATRLRQINGGLDLEPVVADLISANAEDVLLRGRFGAPDVLVDGTDNFETRFLVNDFAVQEAIPFVYGGAVRTAGMSMNVLPDEAGMPCLRCLFREPPPAGSQPTCDTTGVLGPLIAIVAGTQSTEALKLLLGRRESVSRELREFDPWAGTNRAMDLRGARDPGCPCCGERRFEFLRGERGVPAHVLCGRGAVQVTPAASVRLCLESLRERLGPPFEVSRFFLRGEVEGTLLLTVFADGRAIVDGTTDPSVARGVYDRYVGA